MSLNTLREQTQAITKNAGPVLKTGGGKSCEIVATLNQVEQANAQR